MDELANIVNIDVKARVPPSAAEHTSTQIDERPGCGERPVSQPGHKRLRGARRRQLNRCGGSESANGDWAARVTLWRARMGRLMEVVTVSAVLASLAGCERWSLDRQMEELCRKDGGINVYERVTLPATYFDDMGRVRLGPPMPWGANKPNSESLFQRIGDDEFRLITETTYLKKGDPMKGDGVLGRTEHRLVRVRDQRVLAVAVSYGRSGGDFVVIDHYSSKSCPVPTRGTSIESAIVKGE